MLEARIQPSGVEKCIFDGVSGLNNLGALKPRDRADEVVLHVFWKRGGDAVGVDEGGFEAFWLEEDLVAVAIAEALHLVFDRRAIAWTAAFDRASKERRSVDIGLDDGVRFGSGAGDRAIDLREAASGQEGGHRPVGRLGRLALEASPVDRPTVEARRRSGFEAALGEAEVFELVGEPERRPLPGPAAGYLIEAAEQGRSEESAGGDDESTTFDAVARREEYAANRATLDQNARDFRLDERDGGLRNHVGDC